MDSKRCPRCAQEKPLTEYHKNGGGRLSSHCRSCESEKYQQRKSAPRLVERRGRNQRGYRKSNHRKWVAGDIAIPLVKVCSRCRETKTGSQFYKNSTRPDGLSGWCRDCVYEYSQARKSVTQ